LPIQLGRKSNSLKGSTFLIHKITQKTNITHLSVLVVGGFVLDVLVERGVEVISVVETVGLGVGVWVVSVVLLELIIHCLIKYTILIN
jgi:hypothetical protein